MRQKMTTYYVTYEQTHYLCAPTIDCELVTLPEGKTPVNWILAKQKKEAIKLSRVVLLNFWVV